MVKITLGSKAKENFTCSNCGKSIPAGEQFTYKGKNANLVFLCSSCKESTNQAFVAQTKDIKAIPSFIGGFIGAFLGGLAWYIIELLTGYEIGYVAIGVGFLVVKGIGIGSGNKRGQMLQIMAMLLTLFAIAGAKYFLGVHFIADALWKKYPDADSMKLYLYSMKSAANTFFRYAVDPIGVFIWVIALYVAYSGLKPAKI